MSALADMSHKCDKKSSRTFQRNFSEEKFLSGRPPGEGSPSLRLWRKFTHSCAQQRTHKEFRALRSASRGSSPTPRKPSRRLDPSFASRYASKSYVNITRLGQIFADITRVRRSCILTIRMQLRGNCSPQGRYMRFWRTYRALSLTCSVTFGPGPSSTISQS